MSVILTGVTECIAGMAKMAQRQNAATYQGLSKSAHLLEREIKADLSTGSHAPGEPTSSPPGEPPDLVSGDLRRSIQVDGPNSVSGTQWEASVGPTVVYSRIQELGGDTGHATLPARPYVGPALERMKPVMAGVMKDAWRAGQAL
jgi:hypothetical protein